MSCDFESLYYGEEGYVVRCKQCGHYQVAFISTMLTLHEEAFKDFYRQVKCKALQAYSNINQDSKIIIIPTPSRDVQVILTPLELMRLYHVMEEADTELKTREMFYLFKPA